MSVFTSSFLSSGEANLAQLLTEIESKLPARIAYDTIPGGIQNTSGTADIFSQSFDCEADDVVLFIAQFTCSASSSGTLLTVRSKLDSSPQYLTDKSNMPIATTGRGMDGLLISPWKNLSAGSHTAGIEMVVTGGGTAYIANLVPYIIAFKRRT